jgi:PAS domain S-box-containing protein
MEDAASAVDEASKLARRPQLYQRDVFARVGAALIVTGACFSAYRAYSSFAGADGPLLLLLPAVVISAWVGGLIPGLLSTALCALLVSLFGLNAHFDFSHSQAQLELLMFLPIGGFVSYICGSMHAAREFAEATVSQLALSQERYRLISETVSDYAFSYRFGAVPEADELVWITPSFERLTGYKPEGDATPIDWTRIVHPEDLQLAWGLVRDLREGKAGTREYRVIGADGSVCWHRVYGRPLEDSRGRVIGCVGGGKDITTRKRMEAAVQESEARYRTIVETSSEGIWQMNAQWRTTFANRRMAEILGTTPDEMQGRSLLEFIFPEDRANVEQAMEHRESGHPASMERRYRRRDGSEVWCNLGVTPLFDPQGHFAGAVGMHSDITESRRHAEALRESEERFRQLANSVPQIVITANPEGTSGTISPVYRKVHPARSRGVPSCIRTITTNSAGTGSVPARSKLRSTVSAACAVTMASTAGTSARACRYATAAERSSAGSPP